MGDEPRKCRTYSTPSRQGIRARRGFSKSRGQHASRGGHENDRHQTKRCPVPCELEQRGAVTFTDEHLRRRVPERKARMMKLESSNQIRMSNEEARNGRMLRSCFEIRVSTFELDSRIRTSSFELLGLVCGSTRPANQTRTPSTIDRRGSFDSRVVAEPIPLCGRRCRRPWPARRPCRSFPN